jgi:uncharacterized protein
MPHSRIRHAAPLILKRLKLHRVLGLLGARQVGKTTLLRDQIAPRIDGYYLSLDRQENRVPAAKAPDHFLASRFPKEAKTLILDEVQKVPDLFDAVKAVVDVDPRPGRFILTGSTEFSRKTGIRESLTGRIGLRRLYPLTVSETYQRKAAFPWVRLENKGGEAKNTEVTFWTERGGMPGICFIREESERDALWQTWVDTTCYRDIQQIRGGRLSGDLAKEILAALARLEHPTASEVAVQLRTDARRIKSHLEALEALFVLQRLDPHPLGVGKPLYQLFDAGLATHLGASPLARLKIWALNECLAQYEYHGDGRPLIRHYQSSKRSAVDLVIETRTHRRAVVLTDEEVVSAYDSRRLIRFLEKATDLKTEGLFLAPVQNPYAIAKGIRVAPWAQMGG